MDAEEMNRRVTRVSRKLSSAIRRQARGRWKEVRTAERNERSRRVWRFRSGPDHGECFLHIDRRAMVNGNDPAARLMEQLEAERWLDRLQDGSETALLLSRTGQLVSYPTS